MKPATMSKHVADKCVPVSFTIKNTYQITTKGNPVSFTYLAKKFSRNKTQFTD